MCHILFNTVSLYIHLVFFGVSGGYNLKTGPGCLIELMKFDMGGSAATLGAAKAIGEIKPSGVEASLLTLLVLRIRQHMFQCGQHLLYSQVHLLLCLHEYD